MKLKASLGSTAVRFSSKDNVTIKIKNNSGYLMDIIPKISSDNVISFSSSNLQDLPTGNYDIELWSIGKSGTSIYPSSGYLKFKISENAIGFNGETIPTITLHDFEERIDKLEKDLRAKADNGDFDGEKGEPGDKGDPGKDATNNDPNAVHVSGDQAISGVKNFIDTPTINGNKVLDDSLQIGGRNLVLDSSANSTILESNRYYIYRLSVDEMKPTKYVVSTYVKDTKNTDGISIGLYRTTNGTDALTVNADIVNGYAYGIIDLSNIDDYKDYVYMIIYTGKDNWGGSQGKSITSYNRQVKIGSQFTDYTPAPEDIGTSQPIMSGNYGLRVTSGGFQKTTDGGVTWTTANI